jgi:hypothetical protein
VIARGELRAALRPALRAGAPAALRLGGAGVLGAGIGLLARGVDAAALAALEPPALPSLPALPAVPALPVLPALPAWWPAAALLVVGLALACTAAALWRGPAARRATAPLAAADRGSLVPALAADGVARAEIARRTGLSRDAVALSLNLAARQA